MRHWKDPRPPPLTEIVEPSNTHATYELMVASTQGTCQNMCSRWHQLVDWYRRRGKDRGY